MKDNITLREVSSIKADTERKIKEALEYFSGRTGMDIDGVSFNSETINAINLGNKTHIIENVKIDVKLH